MKYLRSIFVRRRWNIGLGAIADGDDLSSRKAIKHCAHHGFLRHALEFLGVLGLPLLGERQLTTLARERDDPTHARPLLELLREIARKRTRRARSRPELDLSGLEAHEMDVIFDLHFEH